MYLQRPGLESLTSLVHDGRKRSARKPPAPDHYAGSVPAPLVDLARLAPQNRVLKSPPIYKVQ